MMKKHTFKSIALTLLSTSALSGGAQVAQAESFDITPERNFIVNGVPYVYSFGQDISGHGYFYTPALGTVIVPDLLGGIVSAEVTGMVADGSIVAGSGWTATGQQAFYWTSGTGTVSLGDTGFPHESGSLAISGDGSTIVGWYVNPSSKDETFYWTRATGMQPLNGQAGWDGHSPTHVNYTGSAITGSGEYMGQWHGYHWTQATGMTAIPHLSVNTSYNQGNYISRDGSTVVGYNEYMFTGGQGFVWTQATGTVGLGYIGTDTLSSGQFSNDDGSVVYGYSFGSGLNNYTPFRWTSGTGPVPISQIMTDAGIDLSDFSIDWIESASNDGLLLSGEAYEISTGLYHSFLANLAAAAIVTPDAIGESINSTPSLKIQATERALAKVQQSLFAARLSPMTSAAPRPAAAVSDSFAFSSPSDISPAAGGGRYAFDNSRLSGFLVGSLTGGHDNDLDNWGVNGVAGFKLPLSDDFSIGLGINGGLTRSTGIFDSHTDMTSKGASLLTSYEPDSGLRFYSSLFGAKLDIDTHREYDVGFIDASKGSTNGYAYGGAARLGWEFALNSGTSLQPFAEAHITHVEVDGYTETGGSFNATFSEQSETSRMGKLGVQMTHDVSPSLQISTQLAYVHSPSSTGSDVQASVGGLNLITGGSEGDRNWGEAMVGAQWAVSDQLEFSTEISGRTGQAHNPQGTLTFGLSYNF